MRVCVQNSLVAATLHQTSIFDLPFLPLTLPSLKLHQSIMSASEDWQVMHEVGNDTQEGQSESRKSDKFYDETGDVEIVSSDGTIYKIHSYYLQASSYVQF